MKDFAGLRARAALKLGFDRPWQRWSAVPLENSVCDDCVKILGIDEKAIHVEERGANAGWWGFAIPC